jgi:glycosyltransferase involved in cell wall biosynthesis
MGLRITYIARTFLDYRIPVLTELDHLCDGQLHFISSEKWMPRRALDRLKTVLGERAIYLHGEKSIGVDFPNEANKTICLPFQPGLLKTIADTRPQVLVGDGFFQWTYAALFHRMFHGIPLVVCYERWAHTERHAQWYRRLYRKIALHFTDVVCCNGQLCLDYTEGLGMPRDRLTMGHMAADTHDLQQAINKVTNAERAEMRVGWNTQEMVFLYIGQLIQRKGIHQLLKAWAKFEQQQKESATLVLVGGGPEKSSLRALANDLNLQGVRFAGSLDYNQIHRCYASADAFIIPTLEDNWSLVVPEAMACGLPILCSKYNGCWPELVQDGRNGWVFDPLDQNDILRCLNKTIKSKDSLAKMGSESRRIITNHTPQKAAEAIYSSCEMAVKKNKIETFCGGHREAKSC